MNQEDVLRIEKEVKFVLDNLPELLLDQNLFLALSIITTKKIEELISKVEDLRVSFDLSVAFSGRPHPMNRVIISDLRPILGARAYEGLLDLARKRHKTGEGRPDEMLLSNFLMRVTRKEVLQCDHIGGVAFSRLISYIENLNIPMPIDWDRHL